MKHRTAICALSTALGLVGTVSTAQAVPGFFATKGGEAKSRSTQISVMKDGDQNAVTITTDYDGPMDEFALVIPVPSDVVQSDVLALKRVDIERLEQLTAPRFHEFWEMDPCEQGKPQQIWEIDRTASQDTDFLGAGQMLAGTTKAPPEMRIEVEPEFRTDSEYTFSLAGSNVQSVLEGKGLTVPAQISGKLSNYDKFIVAMVDARAVEVGAKGELMLSPIRYATKTEPTFATSLGAPHVKGEDELLIYVLHPSKQFEVKGHKNVYPPTNFQVAFDVKEKTGEFYAALHDKMLAKDKDAFLVEYAWSTKGCGEPCPNAPLHLHEILTLGGDIQERNVPDAERNPAPPERSEEEQAVYDAAKPDQRKQMDEVATEVARRKALIERQSDYVVTRLHHRFATLDDIQLQPAESMKGGLEIPVGKDAELPQGTSPSDKPQFQTRIVTLHPNKVAVNCENPELHRWGRPPKTFRGARKIWVADNLAWRNRKFDVDKVVHTPIASLGIAGVKTAADEQAAAEAAKAAAAAKESDCGCRTPGGASGAPVTSWLVALGLGFGLTRRLRNKAAQ